jgi:hypothetical protein
VISIQYSVFRSESGLAERRGAEKRGTTNFTEGTNGEGGGVVLSEIGFAPGSRLPGRESGSGLPQSKGAVGNGDGLLHKRFLFWQWAHFAPGGVLLVVVSSLGGDFSPQRLDGRRGVGRGDWQKKGGAERRGEMGTTNFTEDTNGGRGAGGRGISDKYSVFGIQIGEWTGRKKGGRKKGEMGTTNFTEDTNEGEGSSWEW